MKKIEAIRSHMNELGIDGLLVTTMENVRYLTDFTGSSGAVLITKTDAAFLTDRRYAAESREQVKSYEVLIADKTHSLLEAIIHLVESKNIKKLGFESSYVTHQVFSQLEERLKATIIPITNVVEQLRKIKTDSEIKILREAASIADNAFEYILNYIEPGLTELEVALELDAQMRKAGATSTAFDTIVASGYRSALPHGTPTDKVIEKGDMVMLDFGALYKGYHSDFTRTISMGDPDPKFTEIYNVVLGAQTSCIKKAEPGMPVQEVNKIALDYITKHGYGEYFTHTAGHGIGLMISEDPLFSRTSKVKQQLEAGMVATIEPGIYLPDFGGVRIEDMVFIKEEENEVLTKSTKDLIIL